jgi:type IV secretory pathway VirB3-like protein
MLHVLERLLCSNETNSVQVRFQVLTAVSMKMTAFWVAALCSLIEVDRRFRSAHCLNYQGPDDGSK